MVTVDTISHTIKSEILSKYLKIWFNPEKMINVKHLINDFIWQVT